MMSSILLILILLVTPLASSAAATLPGSAPLTSAFAKKMVVDELRKFGAGHGFDVVVSQPRLPMGNQERAPTDIVLDDLRHDETTGRFSAVLIGTVGSEPRFQLPLEGVARQLVNVVVLSRLIARGERISADDLDWIELPPSKLTTGVVTDPDDIIGSEAKRRLSSGRILTNRDVGPPLLVRRGQPVRVVYADGELKLSALGTARDDGAFGELIRVKNPESNLQLQGIATGVAEVTVGGNAVTGAGY